MVGLKPFSRAWEFMLHVDGVACDDGNENGFIELSTGDDVKHQDSLFVSSKSASESDQIWTVKDITGLQIIDLLIIQKQPTEVFYRNRCS